MYTFNVSIFLLVCILFTNENSVKILDLRRHKKNSTIFQNVLQIYVFICKILKNFQIKSEVKGKRAFLKKRNKLMNHKEHNSELKD